MAELRDRPEVAEGDRPREADAPAADRDRPRLAHLETAKDEPRPLGTDERIAAYREKYREQLASADTSQPRLPNEMAGLRGQVEKRQTGPEETAGPGDRGPARRGPDDAAGTPDERRPDARTDQPGEADAAGEPKDRLKRTDPPDETKLRIDRPDSNNPYGERWRPNSNDSGALDEPDGGRKPLFDGQPRREDVRQGDHGDCGMLATVGSVAGTAPEKIRDAIKENPDGTYDVSLYQVKTPAWPKGQTELTGDKITYTVTPDLPTHDDDGTIAGAKADRAAWPAVMEKAIAGSDQAWSAEEKAEWSERWADLKGRMDAERVEDGKEPFPDGPDPTGYVRIGQGSDAYDQADLLSALTGREAEVRQLPEDDNELVKALFNDKVAYDKPVIVGSRGLNDGEGRLDHRLVDGHAYEVTGLTNDGKIELRNPWGFRDPDPMTPAEFRANFLAQYPDGDRPGLYATLS